jgi:hypothetical protein
MPVSNKLYFTYLVDCEPIKEKSPRCGGPASWEVSERTIRNIHKVFAERDLLSALNFNLTPEAAKAHSSLWRAWHNEGMHFGLQPNVPGFRYPKYANDLGEYDEPTQRQIIAECLEDFESAVGFRTTTYLPCCGSRSTFTPRLLYEAGFKELVTSATGRWFPARPDRTHVGMFPFPFWANANHHIMGGCLPLCIIPVTGDLTCDPGKAPKDLRSEWPVGEETQALYRRIIDLNIALSGEIEAPVRTIIGCTHNTERVNLENVAYVVDYVVEATEKAGLELVPTYFPGIRSALEEAMPLSHVGVPVG